MTAATRRARACRAHAVAHEGLNLVPLIDILTSIVFFSLVTIGGARAAAALTSIDVGLPPTAAMPGAAGGATAAPSLTVRVGAYYLRVSRPGAAEWITRCLGQF